MGHLDRYKSKRRQIQNGDNQNGDKSKTATNQNGDRPKRRHAKTATNQNGDNQNGDTSKTATCENSDTSKTATTKTATTKTVHVCHRFGMSPFWIQPKSKTATTKTATRNLFSPFWIQVNTAFWISWIVAVLACHRFGHNQNGDKSKTATIQLYLFTKLIPIQDGYIPKRCLSPF